MTPQLDGSHAVNNHNVSSRNPVKTTKSTLPVLLPELPGRNSHARFRVFCRIQRWNSYPALSESYPNTLIMINPYRPPGRYHGTMYPGRNSDRRTCNVACNSTRDTQSLTLGQVGLARFFQKPESPEAVAHRYPGTTTSTTRYPAPRSLARTDSEELAVVLVEIVVELELQFLLGTSDRVGYPGNAFRFPRPKWKLMTIHYAMT
eukprot:3739200-Rhodomonas_salina.1